ncbi:S-layer homology domain-containing protein [Bacillus aerolatus]|uniref:S-layer homology domain-containing protein n=1 Tax=Bacillus aerolatus TaxID=2653354 RepID=UPI00177ACAD0|nr:S-layer homology domain-containing protein [Bacillus aerolatus]
MKKSLSLFFILILTFTLFTPFAQAATFKDVPDSHRFFDDIDFLSDIEIITGYPDGTFKPDQAVTRAQAAILIGKTFDLDGEKRKTPFADVSSSNTASGYITSAVEEGIISGFPDKTFRPNQTVTRAQMAIILAKAFELTDEAEVEFTDVSPSSAAYPYIKKIVSTEITYGYEDGTFKPNNPVTRGQFAAFLSRALSYFTTDAFGVFFLNVGQGDATLIGLPNGETVLVDAGPSDEAIAQELDALGIEEINTFIATQPDSEHIGGADYVLNHFNVQKVIDSGLKSTSKDYTNYANAAKANKVTLTNAQEGQNLSTDEEVSITVLHANSKAANADDGSVVLEVSHGEIDFLLMSDATIEVEKQLMAKYNLDAEVLKVGQHGAATATSQEFVDAVAPVFAALSHGKGANYADASVLKRLTDAGAETMSTTNGTIMALSDKESFYTMQFGEFEAGAKTAAASKTLQ